MLIFLTFFLEEKLDERKTGVLMEHYAVASIFSYKLNH